jgi:hypothetical protein
MGFLRGIHPKHGLFSHSPEKISAAGRRDPGRLLFFLAARLLWKWNRYLYYYVADGAGRAVRAAARPGGG